MSCQFRIDIDGGEEAAAYLALPREDTELIATETREDSRYHRCPRETVDGAEFCVFHQQPHGDPRDPDAVYPWLEPTPERRPDRFTDAVVGRLLRRAIEGTLEPGDPPCDVPESFPREQREHLRRVFIGAQFGRIDLRNTELETPGRRSIDLRASYIRTCDLGSANVQTTLQLSGATVGVFSAMSASIDGSLVVDGAEFGTLGIRSEGTRFTPSSEYGEAEPTVFSLHGTDIGRVLSMEDARVSGESTLAYANVSYQVVLTDTTFHDDFSATGLRTEGYFSLDGSSINGNCRLKEIEVRRHVRIGAVVAGYLLLNRAVVDNDILVDESVIAGDIQLKKTECRLNVEFSGVAGSLYVRDASIGGSLDVSEATVDPEGAVGELDNWLREPDPVDVDNELTVYETAIEAAVAAGQLTVVGSVYVNESTVSGPVSFKNARVTGELAYTHCPAEVFLGTGLVAGRLTLDYSTIDLSVRLRGATVRTVGSFNHMVIGGEVPAGGLDYGESNTTERASLGGINLIDAYAGDITIERSRLDGGIEMNHLTNTGSVSIAYSELDKSVIAQYALLFGDFNAEFAEINDSVVLRNAVVCGSVKLSDTTGVQTLHMEATNVMRAVEFRRAEISGAIQLTDTVIGGYVQGRYATVGGDFNVAGATINRDVYLEGIRFTSSVRLFEADRVSRLPTPTVIESHVRLDNATFERNLHIEITDQTRTRIHGTIGLEGIEVEGETRITVPAASYSPRVLSLKGATISHGELRFAGDDETLPSRPTTTRGSNGGTSAAGDEADGGSEAEPSDETDAPADDAVGDDGTDESVPGISALSTARDSRDAVPNTVVSLERATVGDISLFPDTHRPTDYVQVLETTFNGFRFSAVREDFRNSDWTVHTIRDDEEGYRDLAVAEILESFESELDDSPWDRSALCERAYRLLRTGIDDPESIREELSLGRTAREQNRAEIEATVESLSLLSERRDDPYIGDIVESVFFEGEDTLDRNRLPVLRPATRMGRGLKRLLLRACLKQLDGDDTVPMDHAASEELATLVNYLFPAIYTSEEVRTLILRHGLGRGGPRIGEVFEAAGYQPTEVFPRAEVEGSAIGALLQARLPRKATVLAAALDDGVERIEPPNRLFGLSIRVTCSRQRPRTGLFAVPSDADEISNETMQRARPNTSAVLLEDIFNQASWRVSVLAALEHSDPQAKKPSPERVEATYLALKNAASDVGDNRAAGAFFTLEKRWARARHRSLTEERLAARLAWLPDWLTASLPLSDGPPVEPTPTSGSATTADEEATTDGGGGNPSEDRAPDSLSEGAADGSAEEDAGKLTTEIADGADESVDGSPQPSEDDDAATGAETDDPTRPDEPAADPDTQEESTPEESDAPDVPEQSPAARASDQRVGDDRLFPVLYAYLANGFFDLVANYGEKPQRVVGFSAVVVVGFAVAFGVGWGPAGFDTPPGTPPYGQAYGYLIVSLASFVSFVMGGSTIIASPTLRLVALVEAFLGAFLVGLFVFTLTRSVHR